MDESRKQFEREFARRYKFPCQFDRHEKSGEYADVRVRASWRMWVASREAIEIKLPPAMGEHQIQWEGTNWNLMREHAVNAIRAAGIKVKE
ncbi:TPA: hypothetical protein JG919_000760 [Enterobacter hormaechei subsp. steigerwaltii]|nr:hypothetical protein [Enterobacter hormaechei subsp. steigerwaltii]